MAAPMLSGGRTLAAVWDNLGMTVRSKWLSIVVLGILAAGGVVAALLWWPRQPPVALASGTLLVPARALADFSLIDNQGHNFGAENLRGHWSLMFFGYTNCPDYCPSHADDARGPGKAAAGRQSRAAAAGDFRLGRCQARYACAAE